MRRTIEVEVSTGNDTFTIFGDGVEGEVVAIVDGAGDDLLEQEDVDLQDRSYGRLSDYVKAVNTLLSPRIESINVS